jgi:hypothetical protein
MQINVIGMEVSIDIVMAKEKNLNGDALLTT